MFDCSRMRFRIQALTPELCDRATSSECSHQMTLDTCISFHSDQQAEPWEDETLITTRVQSLNRGIGPDVLTLLLAGVDLHD